jgi:hypothetical protein
VSGGKAEAPGGGGGIVWGWEGKNEGIEETTHRVWCDLCCRIHSSIYLLEAMRREAPLRQLNGWFRLIKPD